MKVVETGNFLFTYVVLVNSKEMNVKNTKNVLKAMKLMNVLKVMKITTKIVGIGASTLRFHGVDGTCSSLDESQLVD
ncbi:hypothetical protein [Vibrio parahaemolyticus]|uniref:hypothetical protein n=1 Tax=Vibrio parahaemolyticus TaxID=670 RepID=UPI000813C763|nr:hypothetical protein [Vibrio parahaemolyticus]OCP91596.1 hypothetical protein AKH13_08650 [Vibrio parahaemolyticus]OCP95625.1 hypothetical protein AKH14_18000 [Vibrio parahaemolyticus]